MLCKEVIPFLDNIIKAYNTKKRYYHDLHHIYYMFNIAQKYNINLDNEHIMAIWFHDIVYDAQSSVNDNKNNSIKVFKQLWNEFYNTDKRIEMFFLQECIQENKINFLIDITKHEIDNCFETYGSIISDLDLWILSSNEHEYIKYLSNIRKEHSHLNDEEWKQKRCSWINMMLERSSIYQSEYATLSMERIARKNLKRELR